jgi:hypothetical protein
MAPKQGVSAEEKKKRLLSIFKEHAEVSPCLHSWVSPRS